MNRTQTALLLKVADRIEAEPASYDQSNWVGFGGDKYSSAFLKAEGYTAEAARTMCGSTACIAGQTLLSSGQFVPAIRNYGDLFEAILVRVGTTKAVRNPAPVAGKLLGLDTLQAAWLFDSHWRPKGWRKNWTQATVARNTAKALREIAGGADPLDVGGNASYENRQDFVRMYREDHA